jgi:HEPN domain-containing protein
VVTYILNKEELIEYWVSSSESDLNTMVNLYNSKDYHWCLFIGHLVIEKLLKAVFIKNVTSENPPPRTHDLLVLADRAAIDTSEIQKDWLDLITTFNISARYPDYKKSFYKKCTEQFTMEHVSKIKELRVWLMLMLDLK